MTDATVLVPTHRHAASLPYAVRSALAQDDASVEVFVVGDGVEDDTRSALEPFRADPRVRFFDLPKGERHGERNRHAALAEAAGRIVCYLSDDDLLLPAHVATMLELLEDADLAHSAPFAVLPDDAFVYMPFDLASARQQARLRPGDWNAIGLTGAAHTMDAYRRLPHGWRPAPADVPTDLHMWQQFLDLPGFRGVTGTDLTHLHFPSPHWRERPHEELLSALAAWSDAIRDPARRRGLARRACRVSAETAADLGLWSTELNRHVAHVEAQLAEREAQLADVEARLAERDKDLADLQVRLAERDGRLAEREAALAERAGDLADRDGRIAHLEADLARRENDLADRDRDLHALAAALATMESTRTWRLRNRLLAFRLLRAVAARRPATR